MIELLTNNHLEKILDLFDGANRDIRIISPFLSVAMAQRLCDSIRERGLRCAFITRFYIEDILLTFAHFETMLRGDIPKKTRNFLSDCL